MLNGASMLAATATCAFHHADFPCVAVFFACGCESSHTVVCPDLGASGRLNSIDSAVAALPNNMQANVVVTGGPAVTLLLMIGVLDWSSG